MYVWNKRKRDMVQQPCGRRLTVELQLVTLDLDYTIYVLNNE